MNQTDYDQFLFLSTPLVSPDFRCSTLSKILLNCPLQERPSLL